MVFDGESSTNKAHVSNDWALVFYRVPCRVSSGSAATTGTTDYRLMHGKAPHGIMGARKSICTLVARGGRGHLSRLNERSCPCDDAFADAVPLAIRAPPAIYCGIARPREVDQLLDDGTQLLDFLGGKRVPTFKVGSPQCRGVG